jgi:beta-exotoxin I transport system permease protein
MIALLKKTLREQRRAFAGWAFGIAVVAAMYAAFYPSVRHSAANLQQYFASLPQALKNLIGENYTTPAGYLRSETFATLGPILFLVFAIGAGARSIAGEEEGRTLDLLLSTPVRRSQVLFDKWVSMVVAVFGLAVVLGSTTAVIGPIFDLRVPLADSASACALLFLLATAFGTVALAIGCATGRRGLSNGITGAVATLSYVVNVVGPVVPRLHPLRPLSPFRWYFAPDPLVSGLAFVNVLVLAGITAAAYGLGWFAFERRDLRA